MTSLDTSDSALRPEWRLRLHQWFMVFGVCLAIGSLMSIPFYLRHLKKEAVPWSHAILDQTGHWALWALLYPGFRALARRFPLGKDRRPASFGLHVLAAPVAVVAHATLYLTCVALPLNPDMRKEFQSLSWFLQSLAVLDLGYRIIGFSFMMTITYVVDYYQRIEDGVLKTSRLEAQLAQAQLQALKMQLHPHFLFNTLNSISALLHKDAEAADRMIARLGDFLRLTLESSGQHEVTLDEEIEFVKRYLEIEEIRFQDRLSTLFDVSPEAREAMVPNLILQPLVENAIRHGVSRLAGPGRLEIGAVRRDGVLHMEVRDNGPGLRKGGSGDATGGMGIANTRARLAQIYGDAYRLDFEGRPEGGVCVEIEIPYRPSPPAS